MAAIAQAELRTQVLADFRRLTISMVINVVSDSAKVQLFSQFTKRTALRRVLFVGVGAFFRSNDAESLQFS